MNTMDVRSFFGRTTPKAVSPPKPKTKKPTKAEKAEWATQQAERNARWDAQEQQEWEERFEAEEAKGGLPAQIAAVLADTRFGGNRLTARQIAKALNVDKHEVNKVLYGSPEVYGFATGMGVVPMWFRKGRGEGPCPLLDWEEYEERMSAFE